jgi:hypothetical protein
MTREHSLFVSGFFSLALIAAGCAHHEAPPMKASTSAASVPKTPASKPAVPPKTTPPTAAAAVTNGWSSMFDGKSLRGWKETDFAGKGAVTVEDGKLLLGMGYMTGVTWTGDIPRMNYEVELEAMRVEGSDFFCGLTFPVGPDPCSLIVGGWGGGVVGISSLDGQDAANNETAQYLNFEKGRWYKVRLRVIPDKIQAWIDDEKIVDVETTGRKLSIRTEVELSLPLGISTWSTTGALKNIRMRKL